MDSPEFLKNKNYGGGLRTIWKSRRNDTFVVKLGENWRHREEHIFFRTKTGIPSYPLAFCGCNLEMMQETSVGVMRMSRNEVSVLGRGTRDESRVELEESFRAKRSTFICGRHRFQKEGTEDLLLFNTPSRIPRTRLV